jgi:hypothetical protein
MHLIIETKTQKEYTAKEFKAAILEAVKKKNFTELKQFLLKNRKYEYGCYSSEIKIETGIAKGVRVFYTSNPNHFCKFGISFPGIGMVKTLGLDKTSITAAGKKRGCKDFFWKV